MKPLAILFPLLVAASSAAQPVPTLDLDGAPKPVIRGHLALGGKSPSGGVLSVNSYYLERDGRPYFPIVGEFHFSRYPSQAWAAELAKMKSGGINTVASYVFWNLHEPEAGRFTWAGDLDLRRFVELAGEAGLEVIVRIGPFAHGEMRNGGLPDWLYGRALEVRSNDPAYLALVERLYAQIGVQLKGLLARDGGPVIGIQLENEYQHSAAPWEITYTGAPHEFTIADRDLAVTHQQVSESSAENRNATYGRDHMANLKQIALRSGLDVPLYTATGWGNASIVPKASLPVTAGYPYPFWAKPRPSPFYLFKDLHHHPDYAPVSYDAPLYPSVPAELGAGIMPTYARRPFVPEESLEPLIVRVLGSGSNGIGYYMYHGGATPVLDGRFMNEDASWGLPKINYDYQSPLGQYGQTRDHYRSLRKLHLFLASFGERLAPLATVLPESNARITPETVESLRYAARAADGSGFLFLLNFQDHVETHDLSGLALCVQARGRTLRLPDSGTFTLRRGTSAILPVNLDLGGTVLRSALVQPLTLVRGHGPDRHVFFSRSGLPPELVFSSADVTDLRGCEAARSADGATVVRGKPESCFSFRVDGKPVLVLTEALADQASIDSQGRLWITAATTAQRGETIVLHVPGTADLDLSLYPAPSAPPTIRGAAIRETPPAFPGAASFRLHFAPLEYRAKLRKISGKKYAVTLPALPAGAEDVLMRVNYVGDTAMAFIQGRMIDDHFYSGRPWEIGLRRFETRLASDELVLVFRALRRNAPFLGDLPPKAVPAFSEGQDTLLEVNGLEFIPQYRAELSLR